MQCGKGTQYNELGVVHYIPKKLALDEAQASLRAARFTTDLSASERIMLIRDGLTRLKNQGIKILALAKAGAFSYLYDSINRIEFTKNTLYGRNVNLQILKRFRM